MIPITSTGIGGGIAQAVFDAGINYFDLSWDDNKREVLKHLEDKIKDSGKYFITEGGFLPGMPSMMAVLAAKHFDSLQSLEYCSVFKDNSATYGSVVDLIIYSAEPAYVCKEGVWRKVSKTTSKKFDLGSLGKVTCYPTDQYELRSLSEDLGFNEASFYTSISPHI